MHTYDIYLEKKDVTVRIGGEDKSEKTFGLTNLIIMEMNAYDVAPMQIYRKF